MSLPLKWSVKDYASTLYACGFHLEERDMISDKRNSERRNSKEKITIDGDEDFIVFQFNKDGDIDLVKDKSPQRNQDRLKHGAHQRSKDSKKLVFGGSSEGLEFKVSEDGLMISDNEGEEESNKSGKKLSPSDVKGGCDEIEVVTATEENTEPRTLSESTRSDSSAGSFAFPVVNMEAVGSPERMPKSSEHKIERILRFPCCKF